MKLKIKLILLGFIFCVGSDLLSAQDKLAANNEASPDVISKAYRKIWNPEVQAKIDQDIEQYRKADANVRLKDVPEGTEVQVEQVSHDFLFGGNIFLYSDFDTAGKNRRYEHTYGNLFNAATIPFYWKTLEPEQGKPRYKAGSPYEYRRPATDPVVAFCESKGINMNGHAIIYGMRRWGHPTWMPDDRKTMETLFEAHVKELADRYKGRIQRWDVVNESVDQANRGIMPDDYMFKSFSWAMRYFPDAVQFNTNDCDLHWELNPIRRYVELVRNLVDRGICIDHVGIQMHIFNPEEAKQIAKGGDILTPAKIYDRLNCLDEAERAIHISEVTISVADNTEAAQTMQGVIARNLYRLWFSYPSVMGITWWNVVDGGAAAGEPSFSGIYDKELNPKLVHHALDHLINREWKTKLTAKTDKNGSVRFRGFKGKYRLTWKDRNDAEQYFEFELK